MTFLFYSLAVQDVLVWHFETPDYLVMGHVKKNLITE